MEIGRGVDFVLVYVCEVELMKSRFAWSYVHCHPHLKPKSILPQSLLMDYKLHIAYLLLTPFFFCSSFVFQKPFIFLLGSPSVI